MYLIDIIIIVAFILLVFFHILGNFKQEHEDLYRINDPKYLTNIKNREH